MLLPILVPWLVIHTIYRPVPVLALPLAGTGSTHTVLLGRTDGMTRGCVDSLKNVGVYTGAIH